MTVEDLQQQLEQTLQTVKTYVDAKDAIQAKQISDLTDKVIQNREALEALNLSEEDLAGLKRAIELADTLDTEWINDLNKTKDFVQGLESGVISVASYAQQLFSLE